MKEDLGRQAALAGLTSRADDEMSVAVIDAWATTLDVLTFYQERVANEAYLRTATERSSVRELAGAIGYELRPGVAAGAWAVFELETTPGSPVEVPLDVGVKIQSLPGPGELPQVFETVGDIVARPDWNAMPARRTVRAVPAMGATELYLAGGATNLQTGDSLLLVGAERAADPTSERWDLRTITDVSVTDDGSRTRVRWAEPLGWRLGNLSITPARTDLRIYAMRRRTALFGATAPDWRLMPEAVQKAYAPCGAIDWPTLSISKMGTSGSNPADTIFLAASYPKITRGSWAVLTTDTDVELYRVDAAAEDSRTDFTLSTKCTRLTLSGDPLTPFNNKVRQTAVLAESEELALAEAPRSEPVQGDRVALNQPVPRLPLKRIVIVRGKAACLARSEDAQVMFVPDRGGAAVSIDLADRLTAIKPYRTLPGGDRLWAVRRDDGESGTITCAARALVLVAPRDDAVIEAEVARIGTLPANAESVDDLPLLAALAGCYDPASVTVSANVAWATHGESKADLLGSGDAGLALQSFKLKETPLTYLPSSAAGGAVSTLTVRIDGVRWDEVDSLYNAGGRERVFETRALDDGSTSVQFGDGKSGARLPTGFGNVTASYRVGLGTAGEVAAGQLNLLLSRPLGLKSVVNPFAADGGDDPEPVGRARDNAPLTVRTLDRVVSIQDVEDFAAAFAGIGKATATWAWDGEARIVHVTVVGPKGEEVAPGSPMAIALAAALARAGDPHLVVRIGSHSARLFRLAAGLWIDPRRESDAVLTAVSAALYEAFSLAARRFTQSVAAAEVEAVAQRVPGVVGVDLLDLWFVGDTRSLHPLLRARPARWEGSSIAPAELVTIAADGAELHPRQ